MLSYGFFGVACGVGKPADGLLAADGVGRPFPVVAGSFIEFDATFAGGVVIGVACGVGSPAAGLAFTGLFTFALFAVLFAVPPQAPKPRAAAAHTVSNIDLLIVIYFLKILFRNTGKSPATAG